MSKKTAKRQTRYVPRTTGAEPRSVPTRSTNGSRPSDRYEFNPDYTPIIKDLKRIGTLAGTFFAILVVLSFFLR